MAEKYTDGIKYGGPIGDVDPNVWLAQVNEEYRRAGSNHKEPDKNTFTPWVVNGD